MVLLKFRGTGSLSQNGRISTQTILTTGSLNFTAVLLEPA